MLVPHACLDWSGVRSRSEWSGGVNDRLTLNLYKGSPNNVDVDVESALCVRVARGGARFQSFPSASVVESGIIRRGVAVGESGKRALEKRGGGRCAKKEKTTLYIHVHG